MSFFTNNFTNSNFNNYVNNNNNNFNECDGIDDILDHVEKKRSLEQNNLEENNNIRSDFTYTKKENGDNKPKNNEEDLTNKIIMSRLKDSNGTGNLIEENEGNEKKNFIDFRKYLTKRYEVKFMEMGHKILDSALNDLEN